MVIGACDAVAKADNSSDTSVRKSLIDFGKCRWRSCLGRGLCRHNRECANQKYGGVLQAFLVVHSVALFRSRLAGCCRGSLVIGFKPARFDDGHRTNQAEAGGSYRRPNPNSQTSFRKSYSASTADSVFGGHELGARRAGSHRPFRILLSRPVGTGPRFCSHSDVDLCRNDSQKTNTNFEGTAWAAAHRAYFANSPINRSFTISAVEVNSRLRLPLRLWHRTTRQLRNVTLGDFREVNMQSIMVLWCLLSGMFSGPVLDAADTTQANPPDSRTQVLSPLLRETPQPNYDAAVPAQISGRVLLRTGEAGSGAKGVSVTDGYTVVKTDAQGAFTLKPNRHAVFVYITRPAGYDVQGDWFKPLETNVEFELKAADEDEDEYIFVHVTDTHVSQNLRSLAGLSRFVREVNALTPQPRFVVNSGDLLNLHKALISSPESGHRDFKNYVGIMNHLAMPYYNVAGDHTDSSYRMQQFPRGDIRCGKPLYWEYLGPHFFSFEYGRIHFVSVDFGYHLGQRRIPVNGKELDYPTNEVQPMHAEWMRQDMARRKRGTFVVTTSEADLGDHCPGFVEMARQHDVRLQLVGDIHVVSHKSRSVAYRTGGALAGCWWNPKAKQLCPDLSPQGYLIYRVVGEKLDHFYKGLGQRVAIVSHRVGAPLQGRVKFQAHLVQPGPDESLEYSLNGKDWMAMQQIGRPFYRTLYQASVDSTSLVDGLLKFSVRSTSGELHTREFVVANGRDTSSFSSDASLDFAVGSDTGWTTHKAPSGKVDVLFNQKVVAVLDPEARKEYSVKIPASVLRRSNVLSFRFAEPGDGMSLSSPVLTIQKTEFRDPRDTAIRRVRTAHWGNEAVDWGGFIAGDAAPPDETPFHRRQNVF